MRTAHARGIRSRRRMGWVGRGVLACILVVSGLVGWAVIARALAPTENTSQEHFDTLIVLGSPADADGNPSPTELARVTEAVHEYERGVAPHIIITGGAAHNRFVEAQVMARVAQAQGIPAAEIVEEPKAMNTIENACDALQIMQSRGWESAEVISSERHLPRAAMILSRLPVEWRVHAAAPVEPESGLASAAGTMMEILKTVHYLVWSRQTEPCKMQGKGIGERGQRTKPRIRGQAAGCVGTHTTGALASLRQHARMPRCPPLGGSCKLVGDAIPWKVFSLFGRFFRS